MQRSHSKKNDYEHFKMQAPKKKKLIFFQIKIFFMHKIIGPKLKSAYTLQERIPKLNYIHLKFFTSGLVQTLQFSLVT